MQLIYAKSPMPHPKNFSEPLKGCYLCQKSNINTSYQPSKLVHYTYHDTHGNANF